MMCLFMFVSCMVNNYFEHTTLSGIIHAK